MTPVYLELWDNADKAFAVQWWAADGTTPVNPTAARLALVSDTVARATFDSGSPVVTIVGNEVRVLLRAEDVAPFLGTQGGKWDLTAESASGYRLRLAGGTFKVNDGVGAAL